MTLAKGRWGSRRRAASAGQFACRLGCGHGGSPAGRWRYRPVGGTCGQARFLVKKLWHPEVGDLELTYQSLDLPLSHRAMHDLTLYTAEPGTTSEDRIKLLASLAATQPQAEPADQPHQAAPSTLTPRSGTSENRPPTST
ncbi:hypothetical protein NW895_22875 [Streptomyces sp. S.PNR 29]|nr:hypothetical protein [Streptomyces sp. S.PNR 29]MDN0197848.1 hypothetical protein [Streptomyces sp. S.PNR 29]